MNSNSVAKLWLVAKKRRKETLLKEILSVSKINCIKKCAWQNLDYVEKIWKTVDWCKKIFPRVKSKFEIHNFLNKRQRKEAMRKDEQICCFAKIAIEQI